MANFGKKNTAWPNSPHDSLIENDPMIVKVPMDNVDFGSRKGTMQKVRNPESGGSGKMSIRHVEGKK